MSERAIALAFFRHIKLDKSAKRIFAFLSLNFCFMCVHSDSSNITVSIAGLIICLSNPNTMMVVVVVMILMMVMMLLMMMMVVVVVSGGGEWWWW